MMKPLTETDYRERITRVVKIISDDPARLHSLDELARVAHFSRFHFHRIYRAMTGESVIATARRIRLSKAALLLATTESPITEIALEAGYETVQTFSRAFSLFTKVSPRSFRSRRIKLAELVHGPRGPGSTGGKSMQVEIVHRDPVQAHVVRHQGAMTKAGEAYDRLWKWQLKTGIAGTTKEAVGICYGDDQGGDEKFRYFAGVILKHPVKTSEGVELHEIPGGKYANYRLIGSHDGIPAAFQKLYAEWLPSSGYVPDDRPALEIYRNNPYDTPANELITDLLIPIR